MSCHHFDTLMGLFPDNPPQTIAGDGFQPSWSVYAGPCMVNALIRCAGGLHLLYHGGFSSQSDHYELRIEGTRGVLRCRGLHMSMDYMEYEFAARGDKFVRRDDIEAGLEDVDSWQVFYDVWRDYLSGGAGSTEPSFSGRNNLKVFALLSAAIESIASGDRTDVAGSSRYSAAYRHPGEWSV
jgi:predicted dehydrogenase